jgi:hypothetical protein
MTVAKDLCAYTLLATDTAPTRFRFTYTTRMVSLAIGVVESIFRANETFVGRGCAPGFQTES